MLARVGLVLKVFLGVLSCLIFLIYTLELEDLTTPAKQQLDNTKTWLKSTFFNFTEDTTEPMFSLPEVSSKTSPNPAQSWRPKRPKLLKALHYLNLTQASASQNLPLTLDRPTLLSNDSLCQTHDGSPVDILFFVHTAPAHFNQRLKLRSTYMNETYFLPFGFKVRRLFLLGTVKNSTIQKQIEAEHRRYGDVVQGDFLDSYHNLSHKGVLGYGWVSRHCATVRLVVKVDDDVFFDTFKLIHRYWAHVSSKKRTIFCNVWRNNNMGILRYGKWAVHKHLFRTLRNYPYNYCSGMMVMFTGDVIPALFQAAYVTPVFWIDDVYLFGMLPAIASNVTYYNVGFNTGLMELRGKNALKCTRTKGHACRLLAALGDQKTHDVLWNNSLALHSGRTWLKPAVRV